MPVKASLSDLAIFGGEMAFKEPLHVGRPNVFGRQAMHRRLDEILDRAWLTNDGPMVRELEERVARYLDVQNCIAVSNATIGLQLLARALGLTGEVIMPAFTFVATAHAFQWIGLDPVFVDVDKDSHTIDPARVEEAVGPATSAIVGVHLWGQGCKLTELQKVARKKKLSLIYDASHAFGCSVNGALIGRFGEAEIFSFHATKVVNAFEGGVITTNNDELAEKLRRMRNFGFTGFDKVESPGINAKMNEFSAAAAITGLDSFAQIVSINRRNQNIYANALKDVPGVTLRNTGEGRLHNYHYVVLEINELSKATRDYLLKVLHMENILARRYFFPGCHNWEPYRSQREPTSSLPVTDEVARRIMVLPTGDQLNEDDIATICSIIQLVTERGDCEREMACTQKRRQRSSRG